MIYILKTHPFHMTFQEIKDMTFRQAMVLIEEYKNDMQEKSKAAADLAKRSKEVMPVFDISRGIYG